MKTLFSLALSLALFAALPAAAQEQGHHPQGEGQQDTAAPGGMHDMMADMQHCMMMMQSMHGDQTPGQAMGRTGVMPGTETRGGMEAVMQNPLVRSEMLLHVLPVMDEPLGLDQAQVSSLRTIKQEAQKSKAELRSRIHETQRELDAILAQKSPDPSTVEAQLKEAAQQKAAVQAVSFAAVARMKEILTSDQRTKFAAMNHAEMHRHLMESMTVLQMMQLMQELHSGMLEMTPGTRGGSMEMMVPHDPHGMGSGSAGSDASRSSSVRRHRHR